MGELSEMDNSVQALYAARKIELKLEQRKLLGIVTPSVVGIDAVKQRNKITDLINVIIVDAATRGTSRIVQLMGKLVIVVI